MSIESHTSSPVLAGLDRVAFSKRYFPGRLRHDLEGIAAYAADVRRHADLDTGLGDETKRQRLWEREGGAHT